ncbi:Prophage CP4-57 integrase [Marinobacterium sp. xm-g-59]|nr:Prophage CP4-57 integrase [Marinobacterium sp. xm-g-59]
MKRVLSDAKIKNLKPQEKGYKVTDGGGLYVYVTKTGTKSFRYDAKIDGSRKTITFGTYPAMSLAEAREEHEKAHSLVAKGIDPRKTTTDKKNFSYYSLEKMKTLDLRGATYTKRLGRMEKYLFPELDKKDVTLITAQDLSQLLKPIADSGKRETANRLVSYCRQTFDYLIGLQLIENNPADTVGRTLPKPKETRNFAHLTKVEDVALFLKAIDTHTGDYAVKKGLQFMSLVFLRPHNIRYLRWQYVDLANKLITFPPEEMKTDREHKVPLSTQALSILKDMQKLTGKLEYVFMSSISINNNKQPMTENTLNVAITRLINPNTGEQFGRGFITSHGIRHTASTQLNELGYNPDVIEMQLAHAHKDRIRAVYNKAEYMPERTKMMQEWADYLDKLKNET